MKRYVTLRKVISQKEQSDLVAEALKCHRKHQGASNSDWRENLESSKSSLKLELGIRACGESLETKLPLAVQLSRKLFELASNKLCPSSTTTLCNLKLDTTPLTGLVLLYGPHASMTPHYDSPTQPGKREEWLAMITIGADVEFVCNQELVTLQSGDALVMDSMATLHGVHRILLSSTTSRDDESIKLGLPVANSRLGILLWQAKDSKTTNKEARLSEDTVDGVAGLFDDSS
jgi:hypothetical protein